MVIRKKAFNASCFLMLLLTMAFLGSCGRESEEALSLDPPAGSGQTPDIVFRITSEGNYRFHKNGEENPDLVVNEGALVRVEFRNNDFMPHDWVVDEFNAATETINQGDSSSVEFTADSMGIFEYYCSVGAHRARGMYGNLIVE